MTDAIAIHGHDIIDLVSQHPDGIRLSQLMEVVDARFGKSVTFHTCSAMGMYLDGLFSGGQGKSANQERRGVSWWVTAV